jgi:5-formyltetrahydrofolate cyclo-ligase
MTKKELRAIYKEKRVPVGLQDMHQLIASMLGHFEKIPFGNLNYLLSFRASTTKLEVPVHFFETFCLDENRDLVICYPRADFKTLSMEVYEDNERLTWEATTYGIEQPRTGDIISPLVIDCILVPLLAFDEKGYRVGYGKGFYDRFLPVCRPGVITVGVSYFEAVPLISDTNEYDVPLTYCVTPQRLYVF